MDLGFLTSYFFYLDYLNLVIVADIIPELAVVDGLLGITSF